MSAADQIVPEDLESREWTEEELIRLIEGGIHTPGHEAPAAREPRSPEPATTTKGHRWASCSGSNDPRVTRGSFSRFSNSCSLSKAHYHCEDCGLVAWPGVDNPVKLEYLAWEDPNTRTREVEPVPSQCPLPAQLRPYRVKRKKRLPMKIGNRWSLFKSFPEEERKTAEECWIAASCALGAKEGSRVPFPEKGPPLKGVIQFRWGAWRVFVRMRREHLPALEARIWRDVATLQTGVPTEGK